ncbi:MAG: hypothetical protein PVI86_10445 [Phycisphaerae bacterium]|jgi:hypothetical protein
MANTVFILGAGASKEAGAPLMNEFLDEAHRLWKMGDVHDANEDFKRVFQGIGALQRVHSKAQLDIHNIESVFAAFEMSKTVNTFPGHDADCIDGLIKSLKKLIVHTLEQNVRLPVREGRPHPPGHYEDFVVMLKHLMREALPRESVAVLSFNYDMALDYSLHWRKVPRSYGLQASPSQAIPLLKLHGSLNWGHCTKCHEVVPIELGEFFKQFRWADLSEETTAQLKIGSLLDRFEHCDSPLDPEPVLVPPTWHKEDYHRGIGQVWARAAAELAEAENIFVIGYSLPLSDSFFRYLYGLGTVGETQGQRT